MYADAHWRLKALPGSRRERHLHGNSLEWKLELVIVSSEATFYWSARFLSTNNKGMAACFFSIFELKGTHDNARRVFR